MFIQTEDTPNPETLKFVPGKPVLTKGFAEYTDRASAEKSPLATSLFDIDGVARIFLGSDFISVTKNDAMQWQHLKPAILGTIMEHYMSGQPVVEGGEVPEQATNEIFDEADAEIVKEIKELLDTRVRPAVARDGGDIVFKGYKEGIVLLQMRGACSGCPSSTATLKNGVENMLKHYLPQIVEVRQV